MLEAGTRLGSYEIVASIGAGGMGEVHYPSTDDVIVRTASSLDLPFSPLGRRMG